MPNYDYGSPDIQPCNANPFLRGYGFLRSREEQVPLLASDIFSTNWNAGVVFQLVKRDCLNPHKSVAPIASCIWRGASVLQHWRVGKVEEQPKQRGGWPVDSSACMQGLTVQCTAIWKSGVRSTARLQVGMSLPRPIVLSGLKNLKIFDCVSSHESSRILALVIYMVFGALLGKSYVVKECSQGNV